MYLVSPMMRHDRKFNKRRKGLGSLARSPFSFWNALIVQYFCLSDPHTSKSSHIALITAAFQQALAKHPAFSVCTLCCPSPLPFLSGGLSTLCRDVLGLLQEKMQLKTCRYGGACTSGACSSPLLLCQCSHAPACSRHCEHHSEPTPCPRHWAAPLCLPQRGAGQMIQTSCSGL